MNENRIVVGVVRIRAVSNFIVSESAKSVVPESDFVSND